jgi:hypothetical protein
MQQVPMFLLNAAVFLNRRPQVPEEKKAGHDGLLRAEGWGRRKGTRFW